MRWLIALLLTANVMVVLWRGMEHRGDERLARLPDSDIGDLHLLVDDGPVAEEVAAGGELTATDADINVESVANEADSKVVATGDPR